jgi:hypothetical protein
VKRTQHGFFSFQNSALVFFPVKDIHCPIVSCAVLCSDGSSVNL